MTDGDFPSFAWLPPWRTVDAREAAGLAGQLKLEVAAGHRLHGRAVTVIGRSDACDDIAVALDGGGYAVVHLTWARQPMPAPETFPSTSLYADAAALRARIIEDANEP